MTEQSQIQTTIYIDLNSVIDIKNYIESLRVWQTWKRQFQEKQFLNQNQNQVQVKDQLKFFKKYFKAIKPVIYNFSQIQKLDKKKYSFFTTELEAEQIQQIKQFFEPLKQFQIVDKNSSKFLDIKNKYSQELLKGIFKAPQNPIYKIDLNLPPQNNEIKFWKNTVQMPKVIISGLIVKGKGIAAKDLGMPTANIQISETFNKSLITFPNAIYATIVKLSSSQFYLGAACLGTNPHYQNTKSHRFLQIYILNDFKDVQLYGQTIEVTFLDLIRLQAKFPSFDAFLNGMRNDIEITKCFQQQLISKNNFSQK